LAFVMTLKTKLFIFPVKLCFFMRKQYFTFLLQNLLCLGTLLVGLGLSHSAKAQTDKQFWFAAPEVTAGHGDRPIYMRFSTFDNPSLITISQPANPGFAPISFTLAANAAQTVDLTPFIAQVECPHNTASNFGFFVESTEIITAYYEVNRGNNPDIFALKGRNGLGTEFRLPLQQAWNHRQNLTPKGHTGAVIVATEDNTTVTITPSRDIEFGGAVIHPAGVPFVVNLKFRGEVYVLATEEPLGPDTPAGTLITSDKAIAVTLFQDSIHSGAGGCYDLAGDQLVPVDVLDTEYIVMRGYLGNDEIVNVLATQNGTDVHINGVYVTTLNAGQTYRYMLNNAALRTHVMTSAPAYVSHYAGYGCETGMAILPPIDCTGSREVYFTRATNEHFGINLLIPAGFEDDFRLNSGAPNTAINSTAFAPVPGTGGAWVSAQITFNTGAIPSGVATWVTNDSSLFHLGIINGGASSGCRYGYFSSFNAVNLGPDININYGSLVTLDAGTPFGVSYLWNTGDTTQTIDVGVWSYGQYWVEVDLGACTVRDSICVGTLEYVWQGYVDEDYGNPDNWSKGCDVDSIPTCVDDVIIPAGKPRYPRIDLSYAARSMYLESGAEFNAIPGGRFQVCGDFIHQGLIGFPANSEFVFGGSLPQTYSKSGPGAGGEFADLRINNTTPISTATSWPHVLVKDTSQHMTVAPYGTLTFQNGVIYPEADREVVVRNRASGAISGHGAGRFVAGRLRRMLNPTGGYDLPVGIAETLPPLYPVDPAKNGVLTNMDNADWVATPNCGGGTGLDFDGNNDYVQMPASVSFTGAAPRTIELWARVEDFNNAGLFQFGNQNNREDFSLRTRGGVDQWRLQFWGSDLDITLPGSHNTWHHYALVYDGATARVYYDGVLYGVLTVNLNTNPVNLYLGRWANDYFEGQLDNVKIWDYARSQVEIMTNMCETYDCSNPMPAGLVAFYDLEEGTGNLAQHRDLTCFPPNLSYQLANVNFTSATSTDNLLAYFQKYATTPGPTMQTAVCGKDFDTCDGLNNGKWRIDAMDATRTQIPGDGIYAMTLYPNDYTNVCGSGATVMKRDPIAATPWAIPAGFCIDDAVNSPSRGGMTGFSEFGIAQSIDPLILPVELLELEALPQEDHILVRWSTVSERDNAGFEVLRSTDGATFTPVGFVPAVANPSSPQPYAFPDHEVVAGQRYYYQLRQRDHDGSERYSPVVDAILKSGSGPLKALRVYPNPTDGELNLDFSGLKLASSQVRFQLFSVLGVRLKAGTFQLQEGLQQKLDLQGLAKGVYLLELHDGQHRHVFKVERW